MTTVRREREDKAVRREREDASAREGGEREDAGRSLREGGCWLEGGRHLLREGGRCCLLWWEGRTINFRLVGKFKVQRCRNFKSSGLEQVAAYNLKLFTFKKILGIDVCV